MVRTVTPDSASFSQMGLDVTSCCRLCLSVAASERAAHIDLLEQPEIDEIIKELYGLSLVSGRRGSKLICLTCYKKVIDLKTHLNGHESKARIVSINQAILGAQADSFPEPVSDHDINSQYDLSLDGYQPPKDASASLHINLEDCMRSPRFQERLQDRYDLLHLRISGSIYQQTTGDFVDVWYPDQFYCSKCITSFEQQDALEEHQGTCRFKCMYCRRHYTFTESLENHNCPKRNNHAKQKRKQWESYVLVPVAKRIRVENGEETAAQPVAAKIMAKSGLELIPALPAPNIDGEASLDLELNNLLERWYGQNEDLEELTNINLEAIDSPSNSNSATKSSLSNSALQKQKTVSKPAISVKPMSQLVATPVAQRMLQQAQQSLTTDNQSSDVIEIDDDDDIDTQRAVTVASANISQLNKQDQQSLSQSDVLNIVKHFRGIDENESYLIKAKINGASKLICVSKRKGEAGSSATIVNNQAPVQTAATNSNKIAQRPVATKAMVGLNQSIVPSVSSSTVSRTSTHLNRQTVVAPRVKQTANINGHPMSMSILENALMHTSDTASAVPNVQGRHSVPAPVPQLKIAHVESLVGQNLKQPQRILNGQLGGLKPGQVRASRSMGMPSVASPSGNQPAVTASTSNSAPRRIIVGSSSINLLNAPDLSRGIATKAPQPANSMANLTATQQRIVVKRKQIKTVVQSTIRQTSVGNTSTYRSVNSSTGSLPVTGPPPLVRRPVVPQQAPRTYPATLGNSSSQHAKVYRPILPNVASSDQDVSLLDTSGVRYKLSNTTIRRVE